MSGDNKSNNGVAVKVGFAELLALAFIILKLIGVIDWGWGWVLAPIWVPFAFILAAIIILAAIDIFRGK